jgi:CRP-like cAMP-binding protein
MKSSKVANFNRALVILRSDNRSTSDIEFLADFIMDYIDLKMYLQRMSIAEISQVLRACYLSEYSSGEHIFYKGDLSEKFYLILYGSVCVYNQNKENVVTFSSDLVEGQKIGEQGLVTGMPRSMSAKATTHSFLLFMYKPAFKLYLERTVLYELEAQLLYIDRFFPHICRYSGITRIRIAYALHSVSYRRNKAVLSKDLPYDCLYFIHEGECSILAPTSMGRDKCIVKMGKGSCFGEECGLLGKAASHNVRVTSEYALLYFIRRADIKRTIPDDIIQVWVNNYHLKQKNRQHLKEASEPIKADARISCSFIEKFPLATPIARRKIHMQQQRSISSQGSKAVDPNYISFKNKLMQFRSGVTIKEVTASPTQLMRNHVSTMRARTSHMNRSSVMSRACNTPIRSKTTSDISGIFKTSNPPKPEYFP